MNKRDIYMENKKNDFLFYLDEKLLLLKNKKINNKPSINLSNAIFKYLEFDEPIDSDRNNDSIFDKNISYKDQVFIAVCLLRALSYNENFYNNDENFYIKMFSLFDDIFKDNIYKRKNISIKNQNFEKERKIKEIYFNIENDISESINSLDGPETIGNFRQNYFKTINNYTSKLLIHPFLPTEVIKFKMDKILKDIIEFMDAKYRDMNYVDKYNKLEKRIVDIIKTTEKYKTNYCADYIVQPSKKLLKHIRYIAKKNKILIDSNLKVTAFNKKYPFHNIGQVVNLRLIVKNEGPGYAYNVMLNNIEGDNDIKPKEKETYIGNLKKGSTIIKIPALIKNKTDCSGLTGILEWENYKNKKKQEKIDPYFVSQDTEINWEEYEKSSPYSLEAVTTEQELVGRKEVLNSIINNIESLKSKVKRK